MALIKCPECQKEISDKAVSCPNCGCPISLLTNYSEDIATPEAEIKQSGLGIASFVLSIVALFLGNFDFKIMLCILSIVFGIASCLNRNKKHGFAIAGNIISFAFIMLVILWTSMK